MDWIQTQPLATSKSDAGLSLLLPLHHFMRNTCRDVVIDILVLYFQHTKFLAENFIGNENYLSQGCGTENKITLGTTLLSLLYKIQTISKNEAEEQKYKKKQSSSGKGKQLQRQQETERHFSRRTRHIYNIKENEEILSKVAVKNLLNHDREVFIELAKLDLTFILNIITNEYLYYPLTDGALDALLQMKDVRNSLFHPKLNFTVSDFNENLNLLQESTHRLYEYTYNQKLLEKSEQLKNAVNKCYEQARICQKSTSAIFGELVSEVNQMYTPTSCFVQPKIVDEMNSSVVEDLERYILNLRNKKSSEKNPVLLCGTQGSGKSVIIRNLAHSLSHCHGISEEDPTILVLFLDEWSRRSSVKKATCSSNEREEFWDDVCCCIRSLAPNTVSKYGIEAVKTVVNINIENTFFLVDWPLDISSIIRREMQKGNWLVAVQGIRSNSPDWCVLNVETFEEPQVREFLIKFKHLQQTDMLSFYENCEFKGILNSPEMLVMFCELQTQTIFDTDFEMIQHFVEKKIEGCNCMNGLFQLEEFAFSSICKRKNLFSQKDVTNFDTGLCRLFLTEYKPNQYKFTYQIVQEFLAAKYVARNCSKACKDWLGNVVLFKRVFKYTLAIWSQTKQGIKENINHVQNYLMKLFNIKAEEMISDPCETIEMMDVEESENNYHNDIATGGSKKQGKKKKEKLFFVNPMKNPFNQWNYLIHLDDVSGQPQLLVLLADLLGCIPCWEFKVDKLTKRKIARLQRIFKKLKKSPKLIKLECDIKTDMLVELWNVLKNINALHNRAYVKFRILREHIGAFEKDIFAQVPATIVKSCAPFYIKEFQGPFLCSDTPKFFKCTSTQKLENIDVSVFDIASFREILDCDKLPNMDSAIVRLYLNTDKIDFSSVTQLNMPKNMNFKLTISYFPLIQDLMDHFKCRHRLVSLSIKDVFISEKFKMNFSSFTGLESVYISCKPKQDDDSFNSSALQAMFNNHTVCEPPRYSWMLPMMMNLTLPDKLERLMLRNMDFYTDSNNYLLLNILRSCSINRVMILDSQVTLKGVRNVLISLSTNVDTVEDLEAVIKRLRVERADSMELVKGMAKRPRLSKEVREKRQKEKPLGKELIITSDVGLCTSCKSFPCSCPLKGLDDQRETMQDLINLIEDIYHFDILSFSFVSNLFTVRKDLGGDLRVSFTLTELNDSALSDGTLESFNSNHINIVALAQSLHIKLTKLSLKGVLCLINILKEAKKLISIDGIVDPFSLTVQSLDHSTEEKDFKSLFAYLIRESCLASLNYWCSCEDKCYWLKKTYRGKVFFNNVLQEEQDSY